MERLKQWVKFLPWAEFAYNNSFHEGAQAIPFELVYGTIPSMIHSYILGAFKIDVVDKELQTRDRLLKALRDNLLKAKNRMKSIVDKHQRDLEFFEGP